MKSNALRRRLVLAALAGLSLLLAAGSSHADVVGAPVPVAKQDAKTARPLIQVAVLLDTSNSMDGLIDQARASLWRLVTELGRARRHGQVPELQVALYEYGNSRLTKASGWIRQVSPLTTDLDHISDSLFGLTTNGGEEYCGQVIAQAVRELTWSDRPDVLKLIFIAGNEPFSQGPVDYRDAVKGAIARGIAVNTIHCGSEQEGIQTGWREGAQLADGQYTFIDSNRKIAQVAAPQDAELERLGEELNRTYIAYGAKGKAKRERQQRQDTLAKGVGSSTSSGRVAAKASAQYRNEDWDLVDAAAGGLAAPEAMEAEALPEEMRTMSGAERKAHVEKTAAKRKALQAKINKVSAERDRWIAEQKKAAPKAAAESSFDEAVLRSVRPRAAKVGFSFED